MATSTIIGLKELRENTERYITAVSAGKSFTVVRRSRPVFRLAPVDDDNQKYWDKAIDFTDLSPGGIPVSAIIASLKRLESREKKHGPSRKKAS